MQNFDDTWGSLHSHEPPTTLSKASQFSLEQLQNTKRAKLTGWLADLIEHAPDAKEAHVDTWLLKRYELLEESAFRLVDAVFDELKLLMREFNNSSSSQQSPLVACDPKRSFALSCRRDPSSAPYKFTCYQGHLASHNFALLIRSYYETIQIFLLPCEMLFALENDLISNEIKPLIQLTGVVNQETVRWTSTGLHLASETIPAIARELFCDLMRLTLNVITLPELWQTDVIKNAKTTIHGGHHEETIGVIKDLHIWQTGVIFSKAITRDQEVLAKLTSEASGEFPPGALDKLKSQYDDLETELVEITAALKSMTTNLN